MIDKAEKEAKEAALKAEKGAVPEPGHQPEAQTEEKTAETKEAELQPVESPSRPAPVAEQEQPLEEPVLTADLPSLSYPLLASRDNYEGPANLRQILTRITVTPTSSSVIPLSLF